MRKRLTVLIVVDEKVDHDHDHEIGVEVNLGVERRVRQLSQGARSERPYGNAPSGRCRWSASCRRRCRRNTSSRWICVEPQGERRIQGLRQPSARRLLWGRRVLRKSGASSTALAAFRNCMTLHGVSEPKKSSTSGTTTPSTSPTSNPKYTTAYAACKSLLPTPTSTTTTPNG